MFPRFFKIIFVFLVVVFLFYLILPAPSFPAAPPDSLQSNEPADTEVPERHAYFTDYTRGEVLKHYQKQFNQLKLAGFSIPVPTYRLNYPPENAQTLIRDQTRSTFLEEIVHPFRESLFVNGFEPKEEKDAIEIEGRRFRQKITLRYVESKPLVRVLLAFASIILFWVLGRQLARFQLIK